MSTVEIVVIVAAAVLVLGAVFAGVLIRHRQQLDARREEAGALRETAESHRIKAERESAAADQQAARARKAQAEADEKAALARTETLNAQQRTETAIRESALAQKDRQRAQAIDPDAGDMTTDTNDHDGPEQTDAPANGGLVESSGYGDGEPGTAGRNAPATGTAR